MAPLWLAFFGIVLAGTLMPITAIYETPSAGSYYSSYYAPQASYQSYDGSSYHAGRDLSPYYDYYNTGRSGSSAQADSYSNPASYSQSGKAIAEAPITFPKDQVAPKHGLFANLMGFLGKGARKSATLFSALRSKFYSKRDNGPTTEKKTNKLIENGKKLLSYFANRFRRPNPQHSSGDLKEKGCHSWGPDHGACRNTDMIPEKRMIRRAHNMVAQCLSEVPQGTRMVNGSARYNHQGRLIPAPRGSVTSSSSDDERLELRPWVVACLAVVVVGGIGLGIALLLSGGDSLEEERLEMLDTVRRILTEVPLIDGHNDLPWNIRKFVHNQLGRFNFSDDLTQIDPWSKSNWSHTDLPRLKAGMVGAQFWSAYVPCGAQHMDAVQVAMEQIDVIKRLTQIYSNDLQFVTTAAGIKEAHKSGRIASLIGVEGGHSLGSSLGVLRMFHGLGARYLTLTHTCNTPWAGCCVGNDTTEPDGLAHFGRLVVRELNRLGMLVDLSHTSFRTMEHALNVSTAPVIFSHSSAFAICNSNRNVPDYILKLVALNGGIVMVNFYTHFISCNQTATMEDVIAHINHIRKVAGEDHVGIGAGYDGINTTPDGLEDVSKYPELLAALLATGDWTEDQLKKLAGLNMLRVMTRAEQVKENWEGEGVTVVEELLAASAPKPPSDCVYDT